ncbi:MAG: hypothetical protein E7673_06040 [Ruminococcaceae bacterium]|nr:hypothetical protein [Oscillospiraceae bacterium]
MNFKEYTIDFSDVTSFFEMHFTIRDSLEFPYYYGCNWDALWDCLTDLAGEPLRIKIIGLEVISTKKFDDSAETFVEILKEFKHYENDAYSDMISIEIINKKTGEITAI